MPNVASTTATTITTTTTTTTASFLPLQLEEMLHKTKLYQHFTVKELLYMFDTNGDGVLAGAEVLKMNDALLRKRREVDMQLAAQLSPRARTEVRTMFEKHDADGEGSLDTTELQTVLHAMGHAPTEQQLQSLLGEFDYDGSGALDVLEFTALMARLLGYRELPNEQTALLKRVFTYVDIDGDGKISVAELRAVIEKFGLKLTEGQLALYVREFDADGDGLFSVMEFCSLMAKLQGQAGLTANPQNISKDLQLTVRKLEQLISTNEARAQRALGALLSDADVGAIPPAAAAFAAPARAETSPEKGGAVGAVAAAARKSLGDRSAGGDLLPSTLATDDAGDAKGHHSRRHGHGHGHHRSHGKGGKSPERARSGLKRAGLTAAHAFSATKSTPGRERGDGGGVSGRRKTKVATDDDVDLGAAASLLSSASASRSSVRAGGSAAESPDLWA